VIAPPVPAAAATADAQALFDEARRRRRRRWLAGGLASLLAVSSVAVAIVVGGGAGHPGRGQAAGGQNQGAGARSVSVRLPADRVAWVDSSGQLHVGDLATRAQHVVARVGASPADPMIPIGGRLYWSDDGGVRTASHAFVVELDLATGRVRRVARGESVFAAADGRHVYVTQAETRLIELSADGSGSIRHLKLPAGWSLPSGLGGWAVAGGIIVYSGEVGDGNGASLGIWNPGTSRVRIIGSGDLFDAYTSPGARYSLLAWTPASCAGRLRCPIVITNSSTMTSVIVRSPTRYGFTFGGAFARGAFSPDGASLAVFANLANPFDGSIGAGLSELAIVSTATGQLRVVPAARFVTTEDSGWARWLPNGRLLLAGAAEGSYAVSAVTLAARPLRFFGSPGQAPDGRDISYSTTIIVPRH
jgi:hypothetical protein